jgi:MAF protein
MTKVILATGSQPRLKIFKTLNIPFISQPSQINERFKGRPKQPEKLVSHLARLKAKSVAKNYSKEIVIGFDSVGYFNGKILEKPSSRDVASKRLLKLSGKSLDYFTGICAINLNSKKSRSRVIKTKILMRKLSRSDIQKYLTQSSSFKKHALGFDTLSGFGASFVKKIVGSHNSLTQGLPVAEVIEILISLGHPIYETTP